MSLRNTFIAKGFYRLLDKLLPFLQRYVKSPNQLSILGVVIAAGVPLGFYLAPFAGMVFIGLSGLADTADGLLAKGSGQQSAYGAFFDSTLDRFSDAFYLLGFWVLFWQRGAGAQSALLIFCALLFTLLISYIKARAESLGQSLTIGLMERGFRTLYLLLWALALALFPAVRDHLLWIGLVLFCVLTLATVIQRILYVRANLRLKPEPRAK